MRDEGGGQPCGLAMKMKATSESNARRPQAGTIPHPPSPTPHPGARSAPHLPWSEIDTVLLDMDGTLLDLHFDTHFWLHHVPEQIARRDGTDPETALEWLRGEYRKVAGRLE